MVVDSPWIHGGEGIFGSTVGVGGLFKVSENDQIAIRMQFVVDSSWIHGGGNFWINGEEVIEICNVEQ